MWGNYDSPSAPLHPASKPVPFKLPVVYRETPTAKNSTEPVVPARTGYPGRARTKLLLSKATSGPSYFSSAAYTCRA
jgi:hypothetical protein